MRFGSSRRAGLVRTCGIYAHCESIMFMMIELKAPEKTVQKLRPAPLECKWQMADGNQGPRCGFEVKSFSPEGQAVLFSLAMSHSTRNPTAQPLRKGSALRGELSARYGALFLVVLTLSKAEAADQDWANVGGDKGHQQYSNLNQINCNNGATPKVAWTYHTSDAGPATTIECTPIVIRGVMYL